MGYINTLILPTFTYHCLNMNEPNDVFQYARRAYGCGTMLLIRRTPNFQRSTTALCHSTRRLPSNSNASTNQNSTI